jgi:hypothetical protein
MTAWTTCGATLAVVLMVVALSVLTRSYIAMTETMRRVCRVCGKLSRSISAHIAGRG